MSTASWLLVSALVLSGCWGCSGNASTAGTASCNAGQGGISNADDCLQQVDLAGMNFGAHEGKKVYAAFVRDQQNMVLVQGSDTVRNGGFLISVETPLEAGLSHHLDYFIDEDGQGSCGPSDLMWRLPVHATSADAVLNVTEDDTATLPAACSSFSL